MPQTINLINITPRQLSAQLNKILRLGLLPAIEQAAATYGANVFDAADLIAIGSRETNYADKYCRVAGDKGNGFGWLQADRRSFPEWIRTGAWKEPENAFLMGAKILRAKLTDTIECEGVTFKATTLKGVTYSTLGKRLTARERYMVALSAYNCGRWAHFHISKGRNVDNGSTGKDYALDVSRRAAFIRAELARRESEGVPLVAIKPNAFITTVEPTVTVKTPAPLPQPSPSPAPPEPETLTFADLEDMASVENVSRVISERAKVRAAFGVICGFLASTSLSVKLIIAVAIAALFLAAYQYRAKWLPFAKRRISNLNQFLKGGYGNG